MSQFFIMIIAFLVAIGVLVAVHEFGHFWVARRCGIKVLRFSIGFGKPLYRWYDKLGTEYVLSAIPLGGYVSLFGEQNTVVPASEQSMAYSYKPVWMRMAVLIAGPLFNLGFAVLAYWIVFLMGVTVLVPILGNVPKDSVAGMAGLQAGEEIISVEGKSTPGWESVAFQLLSHLGEDKTITLMVKDKEHAEPIQKTLDLGHWSDGAAEDDWLESMGFVPMDPVPPVIAKVMPNLPAAKAGLKDGDTIIRLDNQPIQSRLEVVHAIQSKVNKPIILEVLRNTKKIKLTVTPIAKPSESESLDSSDDSNQSPSSSTKKNMGFIGIEFQALTEIPSAFIRKQHFGILESFTKALNRTGEYSVLTLDVLKKMVLGQISVHHVRGPLTIAKYAGKTVTIGIKHFLDFLGMISISLGVINLLPIPILDGGHLMYCIYECITGRRVSLFAQNIGVWIGGILLIGFMTLAFYNDLTTLFR